MPEIIDVLTPIPVDCPYFIVDTSTAYVDLFGHQSTTPNFKGWLHSAGGASLFSALDNFTILSMGIWLPESFAFASPGVDSAYQSSLAYTLGIQGNTGGVFFIDQFGSSGIQLPLENYEMPIGIYVDIKKSTAYGNNPFHIYGILRGLDEQHVPPIRPRISMISCPDSLNGITQICVPFVKVVHNITLS